MPCFDGVRGGVCISEPSCTAVVAGPPLSVVAACVSIFAIGVSVSVSVSAAAVVVVVVADSDSFATAGASKDVRIEG